MKKQLFRIDDSIKPVFGITNGQTWNGWQCPSFPLESVNRILANFNRGDVAETNGDFYYWDGKLLKCDEYDGGQIWQSTTIEPLEFEGCKFWVVGAFSWVWSTISFFNKELEEFIGNNDFTSILMEECEDRDGNDIYRIAVTTVKDGEDYVEYFEYYDENEAANDFDLLDSFNPRLLTNYNKIQQHGNNKRH